MKCIVPKTITDSVLVSSSLSETEASAYSATVTYGKGDKCTVEHYVYTSLSASNIGVSPPDNISATNPVWSKTGTTNMWSMFDKYLNTQSKAANVLTVTMDASYCSAVALMNVSAEEISVVLRNISGAIVFSKSTGMIAANVTNWEEYFFAERFWKDALWVEFPILSASTITISLHGASVACGGVILGEAKTIGSAQYDPTVDFTDYSIFSTDTFGGFYVSEGKYAKNIEGSCYVASTDVQAVSRIVLSLRAKPTAFFCSNGEDAYGLHDFMLAYGLLRKFSVAIPRMTTLEYEYRITGVI